MIYITACIKVSDAYTFEEGFHAIKKDEASTNEEAGCVYFHAYPLNKEERTIMLWEMWESEALLEEHSKSEKMIELRDKKYTELVWVHKSDVE